MLSTKAGKAVSTELQFDMQVKLNLITKHATEDEKYKFTSIAHNLNETTLKKCFHMLDKDKAAGVDNALYKGLTVVLANDDEQRSPKLMAKLIQDNDVDMIQMTPSRMQLLLNHDKELSCLKNAKEIMIGGEPFPLSLLRTLQEKTTAKIYNMYGPTETTIWSTVSELTNKDRIDIGHPIKNTEIYIVDENLSILPDGEAGEICIAGKGLAKGYVNRDDLTAEKFIYLLQKPDVRVYRTGDLGCYLPDGDFEYLGRTDNHWSLTE